MFKVIQPCHRVPVSTPLSIDAGSRPAVIGMNGIMFFFITLGHSKGLDVGVTFGLDPFNSRYSDIARWGYKSCVSLNMMRTTTCTRKLPY